jgi:hypothetical protein
LFTLARGKKHYAQLKSNKKKSQGFFGPFLGRGRELDISSNVLGRDSNCRRDMSGVVALADAIPDMRALSCANLLKNGIDADQANALVSTLKEHPTLKSLCGNKGDETALDMSGRMYGVGGAIMFVPEIIDNDNGAMTSLNLATNGLGAKEGTKTIAGAIKAIKCAIAVILVPFSCLSDQWFNCWCLLLSPGYEGDDGPESCVELPLC